MRLSAEIFPNLAAFSLPAGVGDVSALILRSTAGFAQEVKAKREGWTLYGPTALGRSNGNADALYCVGVGAGRFC